MTTGLVFRLWILIACLGATLPLSARQVQIDALDYRENDPATVRLLAVAENLNRRIPEHQFRVRFVDYRGMVDDLKFRHADFLLTNSSSYIDLSARFELTAPLATWIGDSQLRTDQFGGVIFTRSDRNDLITLADIKDHQVAAVDQNSLGGFQIEAIELLKIGLKFGVDYPIRFVGTPHENVVRAVLERRADVGFVRTGVIEGMLERGLIRPDDLRVIRSPEAATGDHFPMQVSTPLYPDWPLAARRDVDDALVRRVTAAVLDLGTPKPLFNIPSRYERSEQVVRTLRLPPYDQLPEFTAADIWHRYTWQGVVIGSLSAVVLILILWLLRLNLWLESKRLRLQNEIRHRENLLNTMNEGVYELDARGHCIVINPAALQMLGFEREDVMNRDLHHLIHAQREDGTPCEALDCIVLKTSADGISRTGEEWFTRRNGEGFPVALRVSAYPGPGPRHAVVAVFHDISEQRREEQRIRHLAFHDVLTGLPNRTLFMDRLEQALRLSRRIGDRVAVIFVDLDRFKPVNDQYGHEAGDRLLVQVAARLQSCLRQSDTSARLGGDEFIALLQGIRDSGDAEAVAQKIRAALREPFDLGNGVVVQISASLGVALDVEELIDAGGLRAQADRAMYRSKEQGGDQVTTMSGGL
jgi:diguanylate cyclase (GGDEF)-like protein/PAS domain S-box-containing protein